MRWKRFFFRRRLWYNVVVSGATGRAAPAFLDFYFRRTRLKRKIWIIIGVLAIILFIAALPFSYFLGRQSVKEPQEEPSPPQPLPSDEEPSPQEHEHVYGGSVTAPTCLNEGYTTYRCTVCGETYLGDFTPAKGHAPAKEEDILPTCTESGRKGKEICSLCGEMLAEEEILAPLGHDFLTEERKATCTSYGKRVVTCSRCDYCEEEKLPRSAHDYEVILREEARCGEDGKIVYACSFCGGQKTEILEKKEHDFETITEPVSSAGGVKKRCRLCGYEYWVSYTDPPDPE